MTMTREEYYDRWPDGKHDRWSGKKHTSRPHNQASTREDFDTKYFPQKHRNTP